MDRVGNIMLATVLPGLSVSAPLRHTLRAWKLPTNLLHCFLDRSDQEAEGYFHVQLDTTSLSTCRTIGLLVTRRKEIRQFFQRAAPASLSLSLSLSLYLPSPSPSP